MQAVVLVDAAPGFEDGVEAALRQFHGVLRVTRLKDRNYDMAVLLDVEDAAAVTKFMTNQVRLVTGVSGIERVERPSPELLRRLTA